MSAVLDFDDLCDTNDPYDSLCRLKDRDEGFKVTLFAIPTRCSDDLLKKYERDKEWISLGIHGWRHARHECLAWTSEETMEKLSMARAQYDFAPVFKAPNWETCDEVYEGCQRSGVAVADHVRNIEIIPAGQQVYIYNHRLRKDTLKRLHGHIQPWAGTGLTENADDTGINPAYLLPVGTEYAWVTDVTTPYEGTRP
jgi:hypothetical protein